MAGYVDSGNTDWITTKLALSDVRAQVKKVENAFKTIQDFLGTLTAQRIKRSMAIFSTEMISRNVHDQQQASLCRLPIEVVSMIFGWLDQPHDRVSLALSCKRLTGVFEMSQAMMAPSQSRVTEHGRLMILTQLLEWMPARKRLCVSCLRYLPRSNRQNKWYGNERVEDRLREIVRNPECQKKPDELSKLRISGSHCARCATRKKLEYLENRQVCLERLANLKKELKAHKFGAGRQVHTKN